ncbi:hypothetical protein PAHAL_4G263400 [Panicum hallii]|jgi:hypothetical protein|uniref:Uncharacterized protein n=1 Tax=Panicum hallii TaxID=206008 RepID=A0A2T8JE19_9POAL|nr:hypothetical protein PAHAL_4G263400 [Panicum hallii]
MLDPPQKKKKRATRSERDDNLNRGNKRRATKIKRDEDLNGGKKMRATKREGCRSH